MSQNFSATVARKPDGSLAYLSVGDDGKLNVSGGGGAGSVLSDSAVIDSAGVAWIIRDAGTALTFVNLNTGVVGTPTHPVHFAASSSGASVLTISNNDFGADRTLHAGLGVVGKTAALAGFSVTGTGATAASVATVTVSGLPNNNVLVFAVPVPADVNAGVEPLNVTFNPPLQASGVEVTIGVSVTGFGAGNTNAYLNSWGTAS